MRDAQTDTDRDPARPRSSSRRRWLISALLVLWLPASYLLSAGPVLYLGLRGHLPLPGLITSLYAPIFHSDYGTLQWGQLGALYDRYLTWWIWLAGGP